MAGVLVLVEQHGAVGGALVAPTSGCASAHAGGDGQLVGEVDRALRPFARDERLHQRQQRHPLALRRDPALVGLRRLGALALAPRRGLQDAPPSARRARRTASGSTRCSPSSPASASSQSVTVAGITSTSSSSAHVLDHPVRELPRRRLAQQPGGGLGGQPQGVLADQAPGVGVVGGDGRLAREQRGAAFPAGVELVEQAGAREPAQPRPDPRPELLGGLAGEREAEDLLRAARRRWPPARRRARPSSRSCPRPHPRRRAPGGQAPAITAACSSVGGGRPSAVASARGVSSTKRFYRTGTTVLPTDPRGRVSRVRVWTWARTSSWRSWSVSWWVRGRPARVHAHPVDLQPHLRRGGGVRRGQPVLHRALVELDRQVHRGVRDARLVGDREPGAPSTYQVMRSGSQSTANVCHCE